MAFEEVKIPVLLIILTGVGPVKGENEACMVEGKSYTSSFSGIKLLSVPRKALHRQLNYDLYKTKTLIDT